MNIIGQIDRFFEVFFRTLMWRNIYVFAAMFFLLFVLAWSTTFDLILRQDAFYYTLKGMEIAHGDFSLYRSQAAGWPFFLSFFYFLFDTDNIFQAMFVARWISILLTCFSVLLVGLLCKKICAERQWEGACVVAVTAYVVSAQIQHISKVAYTEPLFLFLTLCCYYFLVSWEQPGWRKFALAALFAGLSYWVRANGLFQLFVILGMVGIWSAGRIGYLVRNGLIAVSVFFSVAAPHLIMRDLQFGSPFDYGPNSKYFVDSFLQVWDDTVPSPSFMEYLSTHTWLDYYHKFIAYGLFQIFNFMPSLFNYTHVWLTLLCISLFFAVVAGRREMLPLVLLFVLTMAGFSIIFHVFGHMRHLIFLIPFIIISCVAFVSTLSWHRIKLANIFLVFLLVYTVVSHEKIEIFAEHRIKIPEVKDTWALWAADHLEGNVALVAEGDILRLAQHYKKPAVNRIPQSFAQVKEQITRVRPGEHQSMAEAVADFRQRDIHYVITDELNLLLKNRRPYLKEIGEERWRNTFTHLQSFAGGEPDAVLFNIDIYQLKED